MFNLYSVPRQNRSWRAKLEKNKKKKKLYARVFIERNNKEYACTQTWYVYECTWKNIWKTRASHEYTHAYRTVHYDVEFPNVVTNTQIWVEGDDDAALSEFSKKLRFFGLFFRLRAISVVFRDNNIMAVGPRVYRKPRVEFFRKIHAHSRRITKRRTSGYDRIVFRFLFIVTTM